LQKATGARNQARCQPRVAQNPRHFTRLQCSLRDRSRATGMAFPPTRRSWRSALGISDP
jgi:hypothetical protein